MIVILYRYYKMYGMSRTLSPLSMGSSMDNGMITIHLIEIPLLCSSNNPALHPEGSHTRQAPCPEKKRQGNNVDLVYKD